MQKKRMRKGLSYLEAGLGQVILISYIDETG